MTARRPILLVATTALLALAGAPAALAATFTVDSVAIGTGDTSPGDGICEDGLAGTECTLGAAVGEANANAISDTVGFSPAVDEPMVRGSTLTITQPLTMNGCSADPNHAGPCVEVRAGAGNSEMVNVAAAAVTIRGTALTGNSPKLKATPAGESLVLKNNWFGVALDGTPDTALTNSIEIQGDSATIGGTGGAGSTPADRNVISNGTTGLVLGGDNAVVQGNFIGTNPSGGAGLFNGHGSNGLAIGIRVADATNVHQPNNNLIGGTAGAAQVSTASCDGPCNVISQAGVAAIALDLPALSSLTTFSNSTTIRGNYIGTDVSGSQDVGNGAGIDVGRGDFTQIGGSNVGDRNLIAGGNGTGFNGVGIRVVGGDNTSITNNRLGLGSGGQAIPNGSTGISFTQFSPADPALNANVGGDLPSSENVISNSGEDAIRVGSGADNITIARNTGQSNGSGAGDEFIDLVGIANGGIAAPVITAAKTSSLIGTGAEAGAVIRIFSAKFEHGSISTFLGSTTAAGNGSWTFSYPVAVEQSQLVTATQTDPGSGNDTSELAPTVRTGTDVPFPTAFIEEGPAQNSTIEDNTPTWRFSSNFPAATFECRYDSDAFASCPNPFTGAVALSEGTHILNMRARVGAQVSPAVGRSFTVDAIAETVITSGPPAGSSTSDSTPQFEFSSPDVGATFQCKIDAAAFAACSGPGNTHVPPAPLTEGQHTFRVRATNALGTVDTTPAVRNFTVDTVLPDTTITSGPAADSRTADTTPTFGFSSSDSNSTFECRIDGASFGPCSGPGAKHTPAALANGQHTFRVRAIDPAGNVDATAAVRNFVVDTVRPETTITSGPAEGSTTADSTPTFGFSSNEASATFQCRVDGASFGPCSGPGATHTTATLADGSHTFRVRATDGAGNVDSTPAVRTFVVDT